MDYSITINLGLDQVILQNLHQYDLLIHWFNSSTNVGKQGTGKKGTGKMGTEKRAQENGHRKKGHK